MTVQSIDKRPTPETNMTPAAQAQAQGAVSVEDAFVALLQQTSRRFDNRMTTNTPSPGKLLSETVTRTHIELKADRPQAARDDGPDNTPSAAKDSRVGAKGDKPRQAQGNAPVARKADAKNDAPATSASDDDATPVATADDGKAPVAAKKDDSATDQNTDQPQAPQPTQVVAAPVAQDQVVIEIDIEETVQVIEVDNSGQAAQIDSNAPAQLAATAPVDPGAGKAADTKDALAGLSQDDRQRVNDLQKKIVDDLEAGDVGDALDAATELVSKLIDKANLHQMGKIDQQGKHDNAQAQAQDLANMLAGSGANLEIKVQTSQTALGAAPQSAAPVVDAMTQMDLAAMTQQGANPDSGQTAQQNAQGNASTPIVDPVAAPVLEAVPTAPVTPETSTFSAVLAAQVEATTTAEQPTQPQPVTALAGVGATQAPDKTTAAPQAAPTARAPRVPLQQQVADQISVQIDKAVKDGADTVKIQLKPLDLGKIEIKLEMVDGRVSATVTADKPETLALLQKDSKGLEKALEDAGLKPEANSTSFNLRGGEQQQNADRGNNNQRSGRSRTRGQDQAPETAALGAAQAAQSNRTGARASVDISV